MKERLEYTTYIIALHTDKIQCLSSNLSRLRRHKYKGLPVLSIQIFVDKRVLLDAFTVVLLLLVVRATTAFLNLFVTVVCIV